MRYIFENTPPEELISWLREQRKDNVNLNYESLDKSVRDAIVEQRLKDQGYLCAYTMLRIDKDSCHVEHIYPRSESYKKNDPEKTVEYKNVIACYPLEKPGESKKKCPYGAIARGSHILELHPLDPTCESRLRYKSNGVVAPTNYGDTAAKDIIDPNGKLLRLNHKQLINARRSAILGAGVGIPNIKRVKKKKLQRKITRLITKQLSESEAMRLKVEILQFKRGDKLPPHCVAISHAAEEHIQRIAKDRQVRKYSRAKPSR